MWDGNTGCRKHPAWEILLQFFFWTINKKIGPKKAAPREKNMSLGGGFHLLTHTCPLEWGRTNYNIWAEFINIIFFFTFFSTTRFFHYLVTSSIAFLFANLWDNTYRVEFGQVKTFGDIANVVLVVDSCRLLVLNSGNARFPEHNRSGIKHLWSLANRFLILTTISHLNFPRTLSAESLFSKTISTIVY